MTGGNLTSFRSLARGGGGGVGVIRSGAEGEAVVLKVAKIASTVSVCRPGLYSMSSPVRSTARRARCHAAAVVTVEWRQ